MGKRSVKQYDGLLILDKPKGPTSTACLEKIKRFFKQKKVGHAGTLDPMASGVLVLLFGQGTKLASYIMEGLKTYRGKIELGKETDTYDIEGNIVKSVTIDGLKKEDVEQAVLEWKHLTEQEVPQYSAAKYKGRPFYALKRKGRNPPKKTKKIFIDYVEILDIRLPYVEFRVRCSKGTYIRSLAHSLGKRLNVGGVLVELIREEVFPYHIHQAVALDYLLSNPEVFPEKIIPLHNALPHWQKVEVDREIALQVKNGAMLRVSDIKDEKEVKEGDKAIFLDTQKEALALMEVIKRDGELFWKVLRGLWKKKYY